MSDRLYTLEGSMLVRDGLIKDQESTIFAHYACFTSTSTSTASHPYRNKLRWMVNDDHSVTKGTCILCGKPFQIKGRHDPEAAFQEHYL